MQVHGVQFASSYRAAIGNKRMKPRYVKVYLAGKFFSFFGWVPIPIRWVFDRPSVPLALSFGRPNARFAPRKVPQSLVFRSALDISFYGK